MILPEQEKVQEADKKLRDAIRYTKLVNSYASKKGQRGFVVLDIEAAEIITEFLATFAYD